MTFKQFEDSPSSGRPILLYKFLLNDKVWRYTSADDDVIRDDVDHLGVAVVDALWKAVPIADDGIRQTGDPVSDALRITASSFIEVARAYLLFAPSTPVSVFLFATHEGETQKAVFYVGEITSANITVPGTIEFICETTASSMERSGLRFTWQRTCPYVLYDPVTCKVDKLLHEFSGEIEMIEDNKITVPELLGQIPGRFNGGFVEWVDELRGVERRAIENQDDDGVLTMFGTADGLDIGTVIKIYPGCARNTVACANYNNLANYGGIPAMQGKSPFEGASVFY